MPPFPAGAATLAFEAGDATQAARFCVTDKKSRPCTFDRYKACRQIAQSRGAFCWANRYGLGAPEENSQICAVTATSNRCNFRTIDLCRKAPMQGDGLRILRPHQTPRGPLHPIRAAPD